jgi:hypothetical protein
LSRLENDFEQILQINGGLSSPRMSSSGSDGEGCGWYAVPCEDEVFLFLTILLKRAFLVTF